MRAAAAAAALSGSASAQAVPETGAGAGRAAVPEEIVAASLATDATTIAAGTPFLLGMTLAVAPGWHVYWKNPGDAGLSTELSFGLPEGFEIGTVQYPVPDLFAQPGEITGYGYADEVVLFAEVTAPATLEPGDEVTVSVTADWLSCAHVCIPGRATRTTTLRVAETAVRSLVADTWRAALPLGLEGYRPFVESISATKTSLTEAAFDVRLRWLAMPPPDIVWMPNTPDALEIRNVSVHTDAQTTQVTFEAGLLGGASLEQENMETVVAYRTPEGTRGGALVSVGVELFGPVSN